MKYLNILLMLVLLTPLMAEDYAFYHNQLTDTQKDQAIELEKEIMAACCFGGPVYSHGKNDITEKQKIDIRRLLLEGKTEDEILNFFREEINPRTGEPYGNFILAAPKSDETLGRVSYWMVPFFAALGIAILVFVIRRIRAVPEDEPSEAEDLSPETMEKIESELADLD